jgi:hypothetical protein
VEKEEKHENRKIFLEILSFFFSEKKSIDISFKPTHAQKFDKFQTILSYQTRAVY